MLEQRVDETLANTIEHPKERSNHFKFILFCMIRGFFLIDIMLCPTNFESNQFDLIKNFHRSSI